MLTGHERAAIDFRHRLAGDFPFRGRHGPRVLADRFQQLPTARQLAETERSPGRRVRHFPASRLQRTSVHAPFLSRQAQQQRRAAAAARRICGTIVGVVRLPKVPMSKGT